MKTKTANIGHHNKINRIVYIHKLRVICKKSSNAELQISLAVITEEIAKRKKKGVVK